MGNSAVFQAGGLVVVLVEVSRKAYLASVVPVIVNAVLNEHQLIIDIVAFVSKGDFPRSRLGEKQRGKILASWVTRKMRTIAQFGIRDADGADSQITEVAEPKSGAGSVVGVGSSLRNVETVATPGADQGLIPAPMGGAAEMPGVPYESSILESPPLDVPQDDRDETPTGAPTTNNNNNYFHSTTNTDRRYRSNSSNAPQIVTSGDYFPPQQDPSDPYSASIYSPQSQYNKNPSNAYEISPMNGPDTGPDFDFNPSSAPTPPRFDSKPLPPISDAQRNDLYNLPSQSQSRNVSGSSNRSGGGLRVANATNEDEDWPQEALMHMKLSRDESTSRMYDGRGYGGAM